MSLSIHPGHRVAMVELLKELVNKISALFSAQIELMKAEVKVETRKMAMAALYGLAAILVGSTFVFFVGISLILALTQAMGVVWASVVTAIVFLLLTGTCVGLMLREVQRNASDYEV